MKTELMNALDTLRCAQGNRNRVAVLGGTGYVVFSTSGLNGPISVWATANRRLPEGIKLTPEKAGRLGDLGLRQKRASDDFKLHIDRDNEQTLAKLIDETLPLLRDVYDASPDEVTLKTTFETVPTLENQALTDAMEHLAKSRTWAARTGLYMTLLKADLLCAWNGDETSNQFSPFIAGQIGTFPSIAIFSDYRALDDYNPTGLSGRIMSGIDIFPHALAMRVGSVLINPHGQPRGELYNNEVQILVDGIKKLSGEH